MLVGCGLSKMKMNNVWMQKIRVNNVGAKTKTVYYACDVSTCIGLGERQMCILVIGESFLSCTKSV